MLSIPNFHAVWYDAPHTCYNKFHHQISLGHYKIAMLDAFTAFFKLWREEVKIIKKRLLIKYRSSGKVITAKFQW